MRYSDFDKPGRLVHVLLIKSGLSMGIREKLGKAPLKPRERSAHNA